MTGNTKLWSQKWAKTAIFNIKDVNIDHFRMLAQRLYTGSNWPQNIDHTFQEVWAGRNLKMCRFIYPCVDIRNKMGKNLATIEKQSRKQSNQNEARIDTFKAKIMKNGQNMRTSG